MEKAFTVKGKKVMLSLATLAGGNGFRLKSEAMKAAKYLRERYAYTGKPRPVRISKVKDVLGVRYFVWW